jgi:hypothetical protein
VDLAHEEVERLADPAELVRAGLVDPLGQIAVALGDVAKARLERPEWVHDRTRDQGGQRDRQRQRDQDAGDHEDARERGGAVST